MFGSLKFWPALALLAGASVVAGVFLDYGGLTYTASELTVAEVRDKLAPQERSRRLFEDPSWREELAIGEEESSLLYNPQLLQTDTSGNVYILDLGAFSVKKFSPQGALLVEYGGVKGQGPGEFINPTDFLVAPDGRIWICDPPNGTITIYNQDASIHEIRRLPLAPYKILLSRDGKLLNVTLGARPYLFEVHDGADDPSPIRFGHLIEDQEENSLVLEGVFASGDGEDIVYAFVRAGYLASYTFNGELRFFVETIDPSPLPKLVTNQEGRTWVDRAAGFKARSVSVVGREAFVLSAFQDSYELRSTIDVYSIEDGAYRYSMKTPEPCSVLIVTDENVYTIHDAVVRRWSYKRPSNSAPTTTAALLAGGPDE